MSAGYQLTQSLHALTEFSKEHFSLYQNWYNFSNGLSVLALPNEDKLKHLISKLSEKGISFSVFIEPDVNNQVTAIAIAPSLEAHKLCSSIPLALKEYNQPHLINKHFTGKEDVASCN